ncbi:MAG: nuclear transport factor 2 family protein [Alphaproteobacteria bacterium]|nr:nuclear transport factor 2 family protein [Alphaproteobacteria bacterium]MBL7096886.1 nuclear transport factor 2 family protein [Alphaproteobacteria bacterium]
MPDRQVLDDFLAMVLSGRHDQAIADFYAEDCTMQENLGEIRRGREQAVAREKATLARFREVRTTVVPPVFVNGDHAVIHWIFEFVRADGKVVRIEELAHQRWAGNKMAEERFYYDPAQMAGMRA